MRPSNSTWYTRVLETDDAARCLAIADFVSVLTDAEVARLSETVPSCFRNL